MKLFFGAYYTNKFIEKHDYSSTLSPNDITKVLIDLLKSIAKCTSDFIESGRVKSLHEIDEREHDNHVVRMSERRKPDGNREDLNISRPDFMAADYKRDRNNEKQNTDLKRDNSASSKLGEDNISC